MSLGNAVQIGYHGRIEAVHSFSGKVFHPNIVLEDGVTIQQRCHILAANKLVIGKNSLLSFDVMITDIDHEYEAIGVPVGIQKLIVRETKIGENCFIGAGVKIQAGTSLGKQCIVGANSVVRGTFPDFCVIVGTPARIVKRYHEETSQWQKTDSKGEFQL